MTDNPLSSLPLVEIRRFETIASTNEVALQWASAGAPDLALVLADEQTAGRGRMGRRWFTPKNTAIAMSLVLRAGALETAHPSRLTGLLAVALVDALSKHGLQSKIKWPNDVLLGGCKVAGILVESAWTGDKLEALVLGMGLNVLAGAVPPAAELLFPATSLEHVLGKALDRDELLRDILRALLAWRPKLGTDEFLAAWEHNLAYRNQLVQVWTGSGQSLTGELLGLATDGGLRLRKEDGKSVTVHFGEVHLRPLA